MSFKRFDVAAELQNLRSTTAKVAKPPKVESQVPPTRQPDTHATEPPMPLPCPLCGRDARPDGGTLDGEIYHQGIYCPHCDKRSVGKFRLQ